MSFQRWRAWRRLVRTAAVVLFALAAVAAAAGDSAAYLEIRRHIGAGRYEDAARGAERALAEAPRSFRLLEALVESRQAAGAPLAALPAIEALIEADPGNGAAHYAAGLARQGAKDYASALAAFRRAVEAEPDFALAYRELAFTHSLAHSLDVGRAELDALAAAAPQRAAVPYGLAFVHFLGQDAAAALAALDKATSLDPNLLDAYRYASFIRVRTGDFPEARAVALDLLRRAQAAGDRLYEANALNSLAAASVRLAAYEDAIAYYIDALARQRDLGDRQGVWSTLDGLGVAHERLGRYDRARSYHQQALEAAEPLSNRGWKATTLHNLGVVCAEEQKLDEARRYYFQALTLRRALDRRSQAYTLRDIGLSFLRDGQPVRARQYLEEAAANAATVQDALLHAQIRNAVAQSHQQAGALSEARRNYEAVLVEGERIRHPEVSWRAHRGLGAVSEAEGKLDEAEEHYVRAVETIERMRQNVHDEGARTIFLQGKAVAYEELVALLYRRHEQAPGAGHDRRAFEYAERAKARAFLDLLAEARADVRKGMTPAQVEEERRLLKDAARLQRALLRDAASDPDRLARDKELAVAFERLESFEAELRRRSPEYAARQRPEPERFDVVQAELRTPQEVLVAFLVGEHASFGWMVSSRATRMVKLPARAVLERDVGRYRRSINEPPTRADVAAEATRQGRALFGRLLAPFGALLDQATRITIVPDGVLHYLPFEALVDRVGEDGTPRYLLETRDIAYAPSASVLVELNRRREAAADRLALLAYGDPELQARSGVLAARGVATTRSITLEPLPHARREVQSIAGLYPEPTRRVRLGAAATESALKGEPLSRFRILHLATHGLTDTRVPARSGLLFAPGSADEDGLLQGVEILNLDLDADLVVLSACGSGLGRLVRGEGLVGVTRAFFYAGARRLVVSLWNVDDDSTATLMKSFYSALQRGAPPARALREAKREMIAADRPALRFPYYWASFVMVGRSTPAR